MVETIRLESGHTLTGIVGSNPTLSAITSTSYTCAMGPRYFGSRILLTGLRQSSSLQPMLHNLPLFNPLRVLFRTFVNLR